MNPLLNDKQRFCSNWKWYNLLLHFLFPLFSRRTKRLLQIFFFTKSFNYIEIFNISITKLSIISIDIDSSAKQLILNVASPPSCFRGQEEIGSTGRFWQLHISIIYPSGSWKNSWSTLIPPSSTTAVTYSIFIASSFCIITFMSEHWNDIWFSFGLISLFFTGTFSDSNRWMPMP